jgi:hypothetical protein
VAGQFAAEAFLAGRTKGPCSTLAETEMHELSPLALHAREDELCTKKPQSFQSAPVTDKRRQVSVKVVYLTGPVARPVDDKCGIR